MHICLVSLYYDARWAYASPREYLERVAIERHLSAALAEAGHQVDVVLLFSQEASWTEGPVGYHFLPAGRWAQRLARLAGRATGREWTRALPAMAAIRRVAHIRPDVVHFHGLILTLNLFCLWLALGRQRPPVIGHYHGGLPSSNRLLRLLQAHSLRRLSAALFSTHAHARLFIDTGVLRPGQVKEVMEVSSAFTAQPRTGARAATGMNGAPVFLWAGRLHPVKDPLTALKGFAAIQAAWPGSQLYLYYLTEELLPELQAFVRVRPDLLPHVHFRGRITHAAMEPVFNSADFFLQASQREYSGYAALEAMACGVIPVLSDIPSFRKMTADGQYGILFPRGDAAALAQRVLAVDQAAIPHHAAAIRDHFQRAFSYQAMAANLLAVYRQALSERERQP